jgi:hypothetical protein
MKVSFRTTCALILFACVVLSPLLSSRARTQTSPQAAVPSVETFGEEKPYAEAFVQKATQQGADPAFVTDVLGRAKQMRDQGLPVQPYFLKANEGLAKKMPPPKISSALDGTQRQTEQAKTFVDRAVERGATVPSPRAKREAILNFQRALLNETSSEQLQKLSEGAGPKVSIDQLGDSVRPRSKLIPQQPSGLLMEPSPPPTFEEKGKFKPKHGPKGEKELFKKRWSGEKWVPFPSKSEHDRGERHGEGHDENHGHGQSHGKR